MNASLDQIFGLTAFRPSVYNDLMQKWCYYGERVKCNIANGYAYVRAFPLFYTDYAAACDAIVASDSEAFAAFPHLQLRYRNGTRMAPPAVSQTAAGERSRLLLEAVHYMNRVAGPGEVAPDGSIPMNGISLQHSPAQYMNPNLSQYHRMTQERVVGQIRMPMHNIMAWLLNHIEQDEGVFSLRPFQNMPGPYQETLRGADVLAGIHNPSMYWTQSQHAAATALDNWGLSHYIQRVLPTEADESEASWNHREWQYWNDRAAYAVVRYKSGSEIAIGPSAMIPPLLAHPRDRLPMFWAMPMTIGLVHENVYWNQYLDSEDVQVEYDMAREPTYAEAPDSKSQLLAEAMAAAVFYATLVVSQTRMGRGHHKPFWTTTPLNTAVCEYWHMRIKYLEERLYNDTV